MSDGQRFEIREVATLIIVENHTWVEYSIGIEQSLYLAHNLEGIIAPLTANVRCHITACAVLGLERAIVAVENKLGNLLHKLLIACYIGIGRERLVDDKVIVTLQRVTIDAGIVITVFVE